MINLYASLKVDQWCNVFTPTARDLALHNEEQQATSTKTLLLLLDHLADGGLPLFFWDSGRDHGCPRHERWDVDMLVHHTPSTFEALVSASCQGSGNCAPAPASNSFRSDGTLIRRR